MRFLRFIRSALIVAVTAFASTYVILKIKATLYPIDSEAAAIGSLITAAFVFLVMLLVSAFGLYAYESKKNKQSI